MAVGLSFAGLLILLGVGAGARQLRAARRTESEPFTPDEDRRYFRTQNRRRLLASGLLVAIGVLIGFYYLSGMDARMDAIPERPKANAGEPDPQAESDKAFTKFVAGYWIVVILLLGLVVGVAVVDFWATRRYWLARFKEIKTDHETRLQRDLAVYRQQRLNDRAKGLGRADDTATDAGPPV